MNSKKNRCFYCNKKVPLSLQCMNCQCGEIFCSLHRLPETHNCSFDHKNCNKSKQQDKIDAMKCIAPKIQSF